MGIFTKVPHISVSFGKGPDSSTSLDRFPTGDSITSVTSSTSDEADGGRGRRKSHHSLRSSFSHLFHRSRSPSPAFTRTGAIEKLPRTDSLEGSDADSVCEICPNNAFDADAETEAEEDELEGDDWLDLTKQHEPGGVIINDELAQLWNPDDPEYQVIAANTEANSSQITPLEFLQAQADQQPTPFAGQAPNLTRPPNPPKAESFSPLSALSSAAAIAAAPAIRRPPRRSNTARSDKPMTLHVGRPIYERNRCTIVVSHGDQAGAAEEARRTRFYFVASDLSEESQYALEWCIGTCMRQGDECLFMTVMETDSKFDPEREGAGDKRIKIRNQKERQEKAALLAREATALLERTKLNVTVTCQAVHAKNARHILVDCIDWLEPTLVIVGSRGLTSLKGTLMGSTSHYLVQRSSVPVMVARRRLRAPPKVYKKRSELDRQARVPLDQAAIEKEGNTKQTSATTTDDESPSDSKEEPNAVPTISGARQLSEEPIAEEEEDDNSRTPVAGSMIEGDSTPRSRSVAEPSSAGGLDPAAALAAAIKT